jgi:hypothetical protein
VRSAASHLVLHRVAERVDHEAAERVLRKVGAHLRGSRQAGFVHTPQGGHHGCDPHPQAAPAGCTCGVRDSASSKNALEVQRRTGRQQDAQ